MSTHNIGFYEDLTKIIFQLSSNKHLISFSAKGFIATDQIRYFVIFKGSCLPHNYVVDTPKD